MYIKEYLNKATAFKSNNAFTFKTSENIKD